MTDTHTYPEKCGSSPGMTRDTT